jgi:hypothetical protein
VALGLAWQRRCGYTASAPAPARQQKVPEGGRLIRSIAEVVRGWLYLLTFITGASYLRKAKLKRIGEGVKISPTVVFKYRR